MNDKHDQDLSERYKDLALIVGLTVLGVGGFLAINFEGRDIYPGPGGLTWRSLPFIYSGVLLLLVAIWAASTLFDIARLKRGEDAPSVLGMPEPKSSDATSNFRRYAAFFMILAYAWAIGAFGFALSTPVMLFVMLWVFGRNDLVQNLFVALVGALLCWILFAGILKLPLKGDLWDPLTLIRNDLYRMTGLR